MPMLWNLDFEIVSLILTLILFLSYGPKKFLPLRRNLYYRLLILISLIVITADIVAAIITSFYNSFPIAFLYAINMLYFLALAVQYFVFFNFSVSQSKHFFPHTRVRQVVFAIPIVLVALLILTTPFTKAMFTIDTLAGYQRQWAYYYIWIPYLYFYIIVSIIYLVYFRRDIIPAQILSMIGAYAFITVGVFLQATLFQGNLLVNCFTSFGMLIIYMSLQNPEHYLTIKAGCFNSLAFIDFTTDYSETKHVFSVFSFCLDHYSILLDAYGDENMTNLKHQIVMFLESELDNSLIFYLGDGIFSIVRRKIINADLLTEKIQERFEHPWTTDVSELKLDVYFSYLEKVPFHHNVQNLISIIRNSLAQAAFHSEERYAIISEDMFRQQARDNDVHQALQKAVEQNSIQVYYQPIYDTHTHKIISAEALARLHDDKLGNISPDEFIVKAEQDGSIIKLGEQIFIKTLKFMHLHKDDFRDIKYIEINLSPAQFTTLNFADKFIELAFSNRVELERVNLEITETATSDITILKKQMKILKNMGVNFSLDDYGTGFSNLTLILQLPLDIIKIDKSLVWPYFNGTNLMLHNIVQMFKDQNFKVLCEGVETREMVDALTEMGVDYLQGFYFSEPLPEDRFLQYLKEYNEH